MRRARLVKKLQNDNRETIKNTGWQQLYRNKNRLEINERNKEKMRTFRMDNPEVDELRKKKEAKKKKIYRKREKETYLGI